MIQEKESPPLSPEAQSILQGYVKGGLCSCDLAISSANAIEALLRGADVQFPTRNYSTGSLSRNHSRNKRTEFPDKRVLYIHSPEDAPKIYDNEGQEQQRTPEEIIDFYRESLRSYVGNDELSTGYILRLLDKPGLCDVLIRYIQEHDTKEIKKLIRKSSHYEFKQNRLPHTINRARNQQRASLGSYISRAFSPDGFPAIEQKEEKKGNLEERNQLIRALPIDPDKVSEEIIIKLGLAPHDFMTYTLQARRRYIMAVRKRFLTVLSNAHEVNRTPKERPRKEKTARILEVTREDGEKRILIFRTTTDNHVHKTGQKKVRTSHNEIYSVYCSAFENREEALRSQEHAAEGLNEKIVLYRQLFFGFQNYYQLPPPLRAALMTEAFTIFKKHKSFTAGKIIPLLSDFVKGETNVGLYNIKKTLSRSIAGLEAKKAEIQTVHKLLSETQAS